MTAEDFRESNAWLIAATCCGVKRDRSAPGMITSRVARMKSSWEVHLFEDLDVSFIVVISVGFFDQTNVV